MNNNVMNLIMLVLLFAFVVTFGGVYLAGILAAGLFWIGRKK